MTDVVSTEQLLHIIQSIPSPKAELFKMWLAQVGRERIEGTIVPEFTTDWMLESYIPGLKLPDEREYQIGKYGSSRRTFLKEQPYFTGKSEIRMFYFDILS